MNLKGNELHIEKLLESPSLFDILAAILEMDKTILYQQHIYRIAFK
jgi:hypothetical protein